MCAVDIWPILTLKPRTAYKLLTKNQYGTLESPYPIDQRAKAEWSFTTGKVLSFPLNKTVRSPSGPGIFAFEERKDALYAASDRIRYDRQKDTVIAEITIPAFTILRKGEGLFGTIVAAGRVKVERLIPIENL